MSIFSKKHGLKILFVASEAAPYIKVGGLGEVMYSLPKALLALGHDARVLIPKYAIMDMEKFPLKMEVAGLRPVTDVSDPNGLFVSNILRCEDENNQTLAYFLENMEYYEKRANTYGYSDDAIRWALLSKGTLEFLKQSNWRPDIIVCSDWQTGLIPNYLHSEYKDESVLSSIATVFSIHNLAYQGMFDHHFVNDMDYDSGQGEIPFFDDPRLLKLNFMRRGIMHTDIINTVSSTYAQEITTSDYGELLDTLLSERRTRLFGILNGIDYNSYNPETDPRLDFNYSIKTLNRRKENKSALKKRFGLADKDFPLLCIISRLVEQKGFGLLFNTVRSLLQNFDFQLMVLGTGDGHFINFFQDLKNDYPDRVASHLSFDEALPRQILGSADLILIPSKFEPSGLTQMEAMRYGVIPLVRKTGGLADSVIDFNPLNSSGTGFVFGPFDDYAFYGAIVRALETYKYPNVWKGIQKRAMKTDFSWTHSAKEYVKLFEKAIAFHAEK